MLLVDALREDFVEFDEGSNGLRKIDLDSVEAYKGSRIQTLKNLQEKHPD